MFTQIRITEERARPLGLKAETLRDLRSLVVLAGPNGAGKSRYLRLVEEIAEHVLTTQKSIGYMKSVLQEVARADESGRHESPSTRELRTNLAQLESDLRDSGQEGRSPTKAISLQYNLNITYNTTRNALAIRTNGGINPITDAPHEVDKLVAANQSGGFNEALRSVYSYFFDVARALHEAEHPRSRNLHSVKRALDDATAFNKVLQALLSVEIEPVLNENRRVIAQIRGRPFNPDELSMGELVLVVWAIILHRQREWLRGACILIDEPENHLHPDVCIRALAALQKDIIGPDGQIWLATHSIPLIAHAGMESVYFVDNGTIEYGGNKIEKVIDRLMGGTEGRAKLRAFISDAEEIAFDVFAAQSLLPPAVASPRKNDPQQKQMVGIASSAGVHKENVRILDYAAGRGRLAAALKQAGLTADRKFTYYAFNDARFARMEELQECLQHVRQLEQPHSPETYLVDSLYKLTGPGAEPMDLVVMCNVLHEIPVDDWQRCFSDIVDVLAEDGKLVILEDQLPHVGELPHANGYVILDEFALKELFRSKDAVMAIHQEKDARLTAFAMTKQALQQVSPETIGRALGKVMRRAREEIRQIREVRGDERTYQLGRKHAHFTMLYANAQLAMEKYPERPGASEERRT